MRKPDLKGLRPLSDPGLEAPTKRPWDGVQQETSSQTAAREAKLEAEKPKPAPGISGQTPPRGVTTEDLPIVRQLADDNTHQFRYGLWTGLGLGSASNAEIEDPIMIGFTFDIDTDPTDSPLFNFSDTFSDGENPYAKKGLAYFLKRYSAYNQELGSRVDLHRKFADIAVQFFKTWESLQTEAPERAGAESVFLKGHYVNSVSGLSKVIARWQSGKKRENFIEVTLHEDQRMMAGYFAFLYNNLTYSYSRQKELIPENLLRFKLHLKMSEIRNYTSTRLMIEALKNPGADPYEAVRLIRNNVTCARYTLHGCRFDFSESSNFGDEVTVAGLDAALPSFSTLKFKIWFDSVSTRFVPALLDVEVLENGAQRVTEYDNQFIDLGYFYTRQDQQAAQQSANSEASALSEVGRNQKPRQTDTQQSPAVRSSILASGNAFQRASRSENQSKIDIQVSVPNTAAETQQPARADEAGSNEQALAEQQRSAKPNLDGKPSVDLLSNKLKGGTQVAQEKFTDGLNARLKTARDNLNPQNIVATAGKSVANRLDEFSARLSDSINRKRAKLVSDVLYDVRKSAGISRIVPKNVYQRRSIVETLLDQLKSDIGFDITRRLGESANSLTKI